VSPSGVRARLESVFRSALDAVDPGAAVERVVACTGSELAIAGEPVPPNARLVVLAAGKAAVPMAAAFERVAGDRIAAGLAVTRDRPAVELEHFALRQASHPVPDERSDRAGREALETVAAAGPDDVLVVLLSGGASSLLTSPLPGLSRDDVAATTSALLEGGVEIDALNAVRKHLTRVGGGRLARASRSRRVEVLAVSDVPGDRIDVIASGPLAPDPTSCADALAVIEPVRERIPAAVCSHLEAGADETPKPGDPIFDRVRTTLLASNHTALCAARDAAVGMGWVAPVLEGGLRGEARRAGRRLVALARSLRCSQAVCLVAGGETAVHVRGRGRGGRNQELALAAALDLAGASGLSILAAGTDGSDGPTDAAGAFADGGTVARGQAAGLDARAALDDNDSHTYFAGEGGVFRTGTTFTSVMDVALVHVDPGS
jgi:glycerate-2-kinase